MLFAAGFAGVDAGAIRNTADVNFLILGGDLKNGATAYLLDIGLVVKIWPTRVPADVAA